MTLTGAHTTLHLGPFSPAVGSDRCWAYPSSIPLLAVMMEVAEGQEEKERR